MFNNVPIQDYRGVKGVVLAEVLVDDNEIGEGHGYVTGEVFPVAGVANITHAAETATATKFYNDVAAIVTQASQPENLEIQASAIPTNVEGRVTGQKYDQSTGALITTTKRTTKYFALGYIYELTNGEEHYVWKYKGTVSLGQKIHITQDDGTESNGQTLTYTGVNTAHVFTNNTDDHGNPQGASGYDLNASLGLVDVTDFFDTVKTPDDIQPITPPTPVYYTVSYDANGGTGSIDSVQVLAGSSIALNDGSSLTPPATKEFAGWAKTAGATSPTVTSPFTPTANTTLYAVWTDAQA